MDTPRTVTLSNEYVTLKPLSHEEAASYLEIGRDPEIWDYLAPAPFEATVDAERWIASMLHRGAEAGDVASTTTPQVGWPAVRHTLMYASGTGVWRLDSLGMQRHSKELM